MTEFKYCVHCENEPAVCFDTEVDAMKFARECADACSCIKVEKSEIGEDGEILNNEVIWAADCDGNIEKEIVSDNEFDTEFPASDIENIDISDDVDYDEIAKQYKEDPADLIDDSKLIKEAVDALEENESEVECKCCFDIFPKESCIKTEKGYICKKCNQELHSHQGTNLDLIDSDPFSLDYEDPRDFDEPEEIEVKDEPVDANEVRKHEKTINEELKVIIDFSDYKPWSGAVDTYELIKDADKLDELEAYFEELYPDGITATQINDILWFDSEEVLKYLGLGDAEDEEIDESIKEHINDRPADIESDQEYQGVDNAVVDCKKYTVVAHSEDEKPVDCKLEKPALEEPLAGKKVDVKLNEAKKDDELPVDPEAAKLEVHTMLNDLVADEIEAINGYDDAKAQIIDTPIEHKDNILDTIDHIKGEEQEHIDELIGATTEIPFDKEEEHHDLAAEEESLAEDTHAKYAKPEGDRVAAYNNALKYAKKENKPYIYGYTNHTGKFFAAETPMKVTGKPVDAEKEFRSRYKNCNAVYVVYPDKDFIDEDLKEEKINIDYVVSLFGDGSHYYKEKEDYNDTPLSPNISGATKFNKKKDISILDIVKDVCEYSAKYMPENEAASLFDLDTLEEVYEKDEDYFINSGLVEIISVFKLPESLEEAKEELPVDPEAAKLGVHTMLNDLVADEIEAINGYDDAKAEIMDTPIEHKDNILDTIDHIKGEEQEHIDELIDATTEIPFDKEETPVPEVEDPLNQDFPEVNEKLDKDSRLDYDTLKEIKSNIYNVIKKYWETVFSDEWFYEDSFSLEQDYYDEKLLVVKFKLRKEAYFKKESSFENFKADLKTIPGLKLKNIHKKLVNVNFYFSDDARFIKVDEIVFQLIDKSLTETKAKPEGDKVKSYNDGLKLAKLHSKPVIYGYTNSSYGNKFFALDDPIVCDNVSDETKKFRQQYKSCNVVYVAYPNDQFVED